MIVKIENNKIVIELPVENLPIIVSDGPLNGYNKSFKVTDEYVFAKELLYILKQENSIGGTIVTKMFDDAIYKAIDNGAEGIYYED